MEIFGSGRTGHSLFRQHHDAIVGVAQSNFVFRADHALGGFAAQLGFLDGERLVTVVKHRTDGGDHHLLSGGHVGRTTNDVQGFRFAHIDSGHVQMVGVRVCLASQHLSDFQSAKTAFHCLEGLNTLYF